MINQDHVQVNIFVLFVFLLSHIFYYQFLTNVYIQSFIHISFIHLFINVFILFTNMYEINQYSYIKLLIILYVVNTIAKISIGNSELLLYGCKYIRIGFSDIIFSLETIYPRNYFFGIKINPLYYTLWLLLITQLRSDNNSFIGHVCGIVFGLIIKKLLLTS